MKTLIVKLFRYFTNNFKWILWFGQTGFTSMEKRRPNKYSGEYDKSHELTQQNLKIGNIIIRINYSNRKVQLCNRRQEVDQVKLNTVTNKYGKIFFQVQYKIYIFYL